MKWHAQVAHVARKDVQHTGWLVLAYAAVVVVATLASGWNLFGAGEPMLTTIPLIVVGMIITALVVQADSPARGDAFWVTLPVEPSAVLAAKIAVAVLVVLGLALVGQLAALAVHASAGRDLPALLGISALSYALWLAYAAALASLTRDLRTFVVALVLTTIAWFFASALTFTPFSGYRPATPYLLRTLVLCGMLLLLAHQYLTRNVRRGVAAAAVIGVLVLLLPFVNRVPAGAKAPAAGPIPAPLRPAVFRIEGVALDHGSQGLLRIRLDGGSAFHQYLVFAPVIRLHRPDGSSEAVVTPFTRVALNDPKLRLGQDFSWLGETPSPPSRITEMQVDLSPAQREALARGGARLSLRGHLVVREPRARLELPLQPGAVGASGGLRARVVRVESLGAGPTVEVETSFVAPPWREPLDEFMEMGRETAEYALVNRRRREAFPLDRGQSSGSSFGLVLPGPRTSNQALQLLSQRTRHGTHVGPGWLADADLVFVEWAPLGSDPVQMQAPAGLLR